MATDPFALFEEWLAAAHASEPELAEAMTVATSDGAGRPSARIVLLKDHGPEGFVFYTNQRSRKGEELAGNPHAALLFHWMQPRRMQSPPTSSPPSITTTFKPNRAAVDALA